MMERLLYVFVLLFSCSSSQEPPAFPDFPNYFQGSVEYFTVVEESGYKMSEIRRVRRVCEVLAFVNSSYSCTHTHTHTHTHTVLIKEIIGGVEVIIESSVCVCVFITQKL